MGTFLVAYELLGYDASSQNYKSLVAAIKRYPRFAEVQKSVWIVGSNHTAPQVRDNLWQHMHPSDRLIVIRTRREAAWENALCGDQWLQENVTD